MSVSICIATYNGAKYLQQQLDSIFAQMRDEDELLVLDDASQDDTVAVLQTYRDTRMHVHFNEVNLGHVQTFSKVLSMATKPYLFMADQDDIWVEGRLDRMREALSHSNALLVSSNSRFIDSEDKEVAPLHPPLSTTDSQRYYMNTLRIFNGTAFYDGCAMAFKKELTPLVLPIPSYIESHDLWIAMAANLAKSNLHIADVTLYRRVHGENASVGNRPFSQKIWSRIVFLRSLIHLSVRQWRFKATPR